MGFLDLEILPVAGYMSAGTHSADMQAVALMILLRRCRFKLVFVVMKLQTTAKTVLSYLHRNMQQL